MTSPRALLLAALLLLPAAVKAEYGLAERSAEDELGLAPAGDAAPETAFPGASFLKFDPDLWNEARDAVESGQEPGVPPVVSTATLTSPQRPVEEAPGFINVDLPYESGLSIAGRKLIRVKVQETRRKSAQRARELGVPQQQRDFEMHQELQVKIKGKVGRKIAVNVDFDDTKDDKKDISVVYTGDPEEVVQEAAFGDIVLSLPSTKFVSYSKQIFGVRTKLKYKNAQFMAVGSRTKGVTETKRFNGNVKTERREITDTAYARRRYYNISFVPGRAIRANTVAVFRDDRNGFNNINPNTDAGDFVSTSTFNGSFDQLVEGTDYALDLSRGLLILTREAAVDTVLAISYDYMDGASLASVSAHPGLVTLFKTPDDLPISPGASPSDVGDQREMKTFYSLGRTRIVPDNGRGNFIFKTQDLNRLDNQVFLNDPASSRLAYPATVEMDFTNGRFNIVVPVLVDTFTTTTHKLYDPSPEHKFSFVVEYSYKELSYIIKPNIVFGSERVTLNGRPLGRDVDYFLDYDSGYLTFFDSENIDETSQIEVTYEFAPFGGQLGETLVGARTELDLVPGRFKAGSTFLYNFAPKPTLVPDIRSTPNSLLVMEADTQLKDWKIPFTPANLSLEAEVATSKEDPNLFGRALVDSMEGVKQEVQAVMGPEAWKPSANPLPTTNGVSRPDSLWTSLSDEQVELKQLIPNISEERGKDKVRLLTMPYSMFHRTGGSPGDPEAVSVVQSISKAGLDFSRRLSLELWVKGANNGSTDPLQNGTDVNLCVDIGQFNENADGDPGLDSEDTNRDGGLNFGEDVGWFFQAGDNGLRDGGLTVGAGNNRLDTEDLDGDGALRGADQAVRTGLPLFCFNTDNGSAASTLIDPSVHMVNPATGSPLDDKPAGFDLNFTGWRLISVPITVSESEKTEFQAVKQVRVTMYNNNGGGTNAVAGTIQVGKLSFIGTTWERPEILPVASGTMTITAVNNVDDPGYGSLLNDEAYKDLYGDEAENRTREQALALRYELTPGSTATTRQIFQNSRDFSEHRNLRFFVQVPPGRDYSGMEFALQLGNETDYYEYRMPLEFGHVGFWRMEDIRLRDLNGDGTPDVMSPTNPAATFRVVGSPSFQRIGQMKLVLLNGSGGTVDSELWVNEIHVTGARKRKGRAQRFAGSLYWPNWMDASAEVLEKDRDFQTLTEQVLNQDRRDAWATASFHRLSWLALNGNASKSETTTPAVFRTGTSDLVSLLAEGREVAVTGRGDGSITLPHLPEVGFAYDKNLTQSTTRGEDRNKDTYTGSLNYNVPVKPDILPGRFLSLNPLPQNVFIKYTRINAFLSVTPSTAVFSSTDTAFNASRTVEMTDEWSAKTDLAPWSGLSFVPNVTWRKVREQRRFSEETLAVFPAFSPARAYQKAESQSIGYSGSWRIKSWLEPRFDGEITGGENNTQPTASSVTAFNVKLVERSARSNLYWNFRMADLLPNFKPTRSLRLDSSWRLENGDAYENVLKDNNDWKRVRPFALRKIERKGGGRMYGLLAPLDLSGTGGRLRTLTARNTERTSLDWTPFDWLDFRGRVEPLRTLRLTTTLTITEDHRETGEAIQDVSTVVWPDVLVSIRDTERMLRLDRWMANSQLNLRTNKKDTKTFGEEFRRDNSLGSDYHFMLRERFDVFMSYGVTDGFARNERLQVLTAKSNGYNHFIQVGTKLWGWQVTPRADFRGDKSVDAAGRATQDTTIVGLSAIMRLDKAYPRGFRIPFTKKVYENVNRLILDAKAGLEKKKSSIDIERNNTDTYSADMTGTWEISRNFRLSFGGGFSVVENRVRKEDGLMSYNLNSELVINF